MKIRIKETGELKELVIIGTNNQEWTCDLLGNNDATTYNEVTEEHEMTQENYDWWKEYIDNYEADEDEISELAEGLGINRGDITLRIQSELNGDLGDEHNIKQSILADIRKEYSNK